MKEAERLEEEHVWRLSRGRSKDRGAARGHSVENRVPRGHSVDSTSINAHHGGGRVGALSRKPGSVDSLLDWDSDSTRPPSIPPRSGKVLINIVGVRLFFVCLAIFHLKPFYDIKL